MSDNNNQANSTGIQGPLESVPSKAEIRKQKEHFAPASPMSRAPRNRKKAGKYSDEFATESCSDYEGANSPARDKLLSNGGRPDVDSSTAPPTNTNSVSKRSRIKNPVSKEGNGAPKKEGANRDSDSDSSLVRRTIKKMKQSEIEAILSKKKIPPKDEPTHHKTASILPKKLNGFTFQRDPKEILSLSFEDLATSKNLTRGKPRSLVSRLLTSSDAAFSHQTVAGSGDTSGSKKTSVIKIGRPWSVPTKIVKIAPSTQRNKTKKAATRASKKAVSPVKKDEDAFIYPVPPECLIYQSADLSSDEEPIIIQENANWPYIEDSVQRSLKVEKKAEEAIFEPDAKEGLSFDDESLTLMKDVVYVDDSAECIVNGEKRTEEVTVPDAKKELLPSLPAVPSTTCSEIIVPIGHSLLKVGDETVCEVEEQVDAVAKLSIQKDAKVVPRPIVTLVHSTTSDLSLTKERPAPSSAFRVSSSACVSREPTNMSLQVSPHCRLGPIFDEPRIRALPTYQWMPIPNAIILIVKDLIRCAQSPDDVFNLVKVADPEEISTIIMQVNSATGEIEKIKDIPLLMTISSAMKWLTDLLESLGCCKNLFVPTFMAKGFVCNACSAVKQEQPQPVNVIASSSQKSVSSFDSVDFKLEVGNPEEKRKAEDKKFRDLWPKEKDFLQLHAFFLHLFKLPEGRNDLRPDIGHPDISRWLDVASLVHIVARTNTYMVKGKEIWKIGNQEPMDSSVLKMIVTHSCTGSQYPVKTDGTMLELWHSLLLRCPKCTTNSSLKWALDKVHHFIAHERLRANFRRSIKKYPLLGLPKMRSMGQEQAQTPSRTESSKKPEANGEKTVRSRGRPKSVHMKSLKRSLQKTSEEVNGDQAKSTKRVRCVSPYTSITINDKPSSSSTPEQKSRSSEEMSTEPKADLKQNIESDPHFEPANDEPAEKMRDSAEKQTGILATRHQRDLLRQLQNEPPATDLELLASVAVFTAADSVVDQSLSRVNNDARVVDRPGTSRALLSSVLLPNSGNISLRVSKDCRIGALFDEARVRSLVSTKPLPFSQEIIRIVEGLIRSAYRPQEVLNSLKVATNGEIFSVVTFFDWADETLHRKKIPVQQSVSSAMAWLTDFLESVDCCKKLFVFNFIADDFICKHCFSKKPVHTEATKSASTADDTQLDGFQPDSEEIAVDQEVMEADEEEKGIEVDKTRKEEVLRKKTLLELRRVEEEAFMKLNSTFFRLFHIPEKRAALRPDIGTLPIDEPEKISIVRAKSFYGCCGNQMWKLGDETPIYSCALTKIIKHSCRKVRADLKVDGTMLELWHSLLLRCPDCIKTNSFPFVHKKIMNFLKDEEERARKLNQMKDNSCSTTLTLAAITPKPGLISSVSPFPTREIKLQDSATPVSPQAILILNRKSVSNCTSDIGKEKMKQKKKKEELEKTKLTGERTTEAIMGTMSKNQEEEGKEKMPAFPVELPIDQKAKQKDNTKKEITQEEPEDSDSYKPTRLCHLPKNEVNKEEVDGNMDVVKRVQQKETEETEMERKFVRKAEEKRRTPVETERTSEHSKTEPAQRSLTEVEERKRRKNNRMKEEGSEGSLATDNLAAKLRKEHFFKLNAFFLYFFKVPADERAEFRADIGNPNDINASDWPFIDSVRAKVFRNGNTVMWQLGDERSLYSSVLKTGMKSHRCPESRPDLYIGDMLMTWFGLLNRCPDCTSLKCLEKALNAVAVFIESERSRPKSD